MKTKAIYYHAGCPVCLDAEHQFLDALDPARYEVEKVNLLVDKKYIPDAAEAGVKSVPALVINDHVFHINHGADLNALL